MLGFQLLSGECVHHGLDNSDLFQHGSQLLGIWLVIVHTLELVNPVGFGAETKIVQIG